MNESPSASALFVGFTSCVMCLWFLNVLVLLSTRVTPSESDLCKFEQNSPNPHRNDSKVPTRHFRAGGKRSNNITQQSSMGPTEQIYITATQRVKNTDIIYKIQNTLKTIERPATDKKQMGLRALKNNQWRP